MSLFFAYAESLFSHDEAHLILLVHYINSSVQYMYTEIEMAVKMTKVQMRNGDIFLMFAQNIRLWVIDRTTSVRSEHVHKFKQCQNYLHLVKCCNFF